LRGYYPGEREHRERLQPRIREPRAPEPRDRNLYPPEPPLRRARAAAAETGAATDGAMAAVGQSAGRRIDRVLGILLGVVFGIAVVVAFLLGSGGTIDAPSTHGSHTGKPAAHARPAPRTRE
jgi:hypothetical protein